MDAPGATEAKGSAHDEGEELKESDAESAPTSKDARPDSRNEDAPPRSEDEDEDEDDDEDEEDEDDEEEDDEEPRLKYAYLTKHINSVYRNGDATSSFITGGDKMIIGTHNGNIHVLSLPLFEPLRVYHAHSASVTSISISPFPPPVRTRPDSLSRLSAEELASSIRSSAGSISSLSSSRSPRPPVLPATPSNSIYIATSSIDGNVCVASLVDPKDVMLRNFGRPVQAVALSPEYKHDRTYLSGGLAGNLILTVGGRAGTSTTSTTIGGAAAAASGWLGSLGLGANTGKDTILHSGEGSISTIKWSLSGKYVTWVNEEGIKIMRTNLHLDSSDSELAWKRISHIDRPNRPGWEEMASVWKARAEWVDESSLESDSDSISHHGDSTPSEVSTVGEKVEKLVVGWGGTIWVINVYPDRSTGGRKTGSAEVATILRTDCIVSGISLYTPRLLLVLAHIEAEDDEPESESKRSRSRSGTHRRPKALEPEIRLIDIESKEEISADTLSVSRYENLSSNDYHMSVLPPAKTPVPAAQRGALGALGNGLWDATMYPARLFSSSASIRSSTSSGDKGSGRAPSFFASRRLSGIENKSKELQALAGAGGMKIFIHSPYDCVVAVKRNLADRLAWLEAHAKYEEAWKLIDEHPEAVSPSNEGPASVYGTSAKSQTSLVEFFADDASSITTVGRTVDSAAEKEKRRIGDLWIQQVISTDRWKEAGEVCGRVLDTTPKWEHWIWVFTKNNKFDEITPYIPANIHPPLPSLVYEVILGHYVSRDRFRFKELLDRWSPDLFDTNSVAAAIEVQLKSDDVVPDSEEWRILMDSLARLLVAGGRYREALHCYIHLQDAEAAMGLIRDYRLVDAVADDIPGFILIRVSKEQMKSAPISELEEATSEPIKLLVSDAYTGIVRPQTVVEQLQAANKPLYLYFYLRALWRGEFLRSEAEKSRLRGRSRRMREEADKLAADEGKALIDPFADIAVELFADYDRPLLMEFLQSSTAYSFSAASTICEIRHFIPELIYLLSKMGQTKRALNLILSDLKDISQAIAFAKSQDDPDLWEDLLNYSMDKPEFIHALLVEAGTAIDPIKLVRRIPSGLEIQGLREGLTHLIREHDVQASISQGAAKVLQSEVAVAMDALRRGQRRGIKFDIIEETGPKLEGGAAAADAKEEGKEEEAERDEETENLDGEKVRRRRRSPALQPGRCAGCHEAFHLNEKEILIGFACGHVFHLSHLHPEPPPTTTAAAAGGPPSLPLPSATMPVGEEPILSPSSFAIPRTVGPKVTTARLLRDRIGDGCRICALGRQVQNAVDSGE